MAINRNCHCFVWNFNSGFQNIGFVLGTKNTQISSFGWMFVYQSQKFTWNHSHRSQVPSMEFRQLHTWTSAPPPYLQNNFFVTQFQTMLMIPGNINFLKKRQLKTLTFAVKQHLFPQFQATCTLCIFSSKDPKDHAFN